MPWRNNVLRVRHRSGDVASGPLQFAEQKTGVYLDAEETARLHLLIEMTICSIASLDESHVADNYIVRPLRDFVAKLKSCEAEGSDCDGPTG